MIIVHHPKIRFDPPNGDSSPLEASITSDGHIRVQSDCDSGHLNATWMTPAELREFAMEALGLADAADLIHGEPS
jgi:hypothetical protein